MLGKNERMEPNRLELGKALKAATFYGVQFSRLRHGLAEDSAQSDLTFTREVNRFTKNCAAS